ncbi:probable cytochrome P450 301a1, mitochondrial [Penaeus japonicus]|uniref:probable cytochrome P450 301a1, mitochondrial n=1 Tax=Penaeus japonicus TaxID=27405 RepID=UPI001C712CC2|nr:probable cytochrome P450 301a1, mitochondrial [Penaeus japonicus]
MLHSGTRTPHMNRLTNMFLATHLAPACSPSYAPASSICSRHFLSICRIHTPLPRSRIHTPLPPHRRIHTPFPPFSTPFNHFSPCRPRPRDLHHNSSTFPIHSPSSTPFAAPSRRYGGITNAKLTQASISLSNSDKNREDIAPGTPYLEAYEIIEEFADVLYDEDAMVTERAFTGDAGRVPPGSPPLPASLIPGPKSWPLLGCLPYMLRHPAFDPNRVYLFWQAVSQEFGPIFRKDMPGHPNLVFITDPEDVFTMYQTTMLNPVRPGMTSLKKIREDEQREKEAEGVRKREGSRCPHEGLFYNGAGILAEQGEDWWRVRRRVQRPITDQDIISRFLPDVDEIAKTFVRRIRNLRDINDEMPHTFKDDIYKWSLESLAAVILERRLNLLEDDLQASPESSRLIPLAKQLLEALHETENVKLWQYFPTASITRLKEAHDIFSGVALEAIQNTERELASKRSAREHPRRLSLLETLIATPGLTRGDVLTFLIDLLATGIDTTSHAFSHMLYLLSKNPDAQSRLINEIDAQVGKPEHLLPEHIASLSYAKATFRETLRVMPVGVGITRRLNCDTVLGGYLVPKGWQVVAPTMLIHHQESVFPRAKEFLPERFLRGSPLAPSHNYAFLPFSFGTRMCIGRRIAYQEIMCLLIRVLSEFTVDYKHEEIHLVNKLGYGPSHPLRFTFRDRS